MHSLLHKSKKILSYIMGFFLLIVIVLWAIMQTPNFQHWIQKIFVIEVQKKTHKIAQVDKLMIDIFGNIQLDKLLLLDSASKDTFVYAKYCKIDIKISRIFSGQIPINVIQIDDAIINIKKQTNNHWNYETLLSDTTTNSSTSVQLNKLACNRVVINVISPEQMEQHISVLKVIYNSEYSLFSNLAKSHTLVESLFWQGAYTFNQNTNIDYKKLWHDIIAFSPSVAIQFLKYNTIEVHQSNILLENLITRKPILLLGKLDLQTSTIKQGFKTIANAKLNNLPISLKCDVEATKTNYINCQNFELRVNTSLLKLNIALSKNNYLNTNINALVQSKDLSTLFPQYPFKEYIKIGASLKGNVDSGMYTIKTFIPNYVDLILNTQYANKNQGYALYGHLEQLKMPFLSDTNKLNVLYPKLKKYYPYLLLDSMNITGEGFWYNHTWWFNARASYNKGSMSIDGIHQDSTTNITNTNFHINIDSFLFTHIFDKGIYNARAELSIDSLTQKTNIKIDKIILKDYSINNIAMAYTQEKNSNTINLRIQDNKLNGDLEYKNEEFTPNHHQINSYINVQNFRMDSLRDILINVFKDSSLLIFRDSVSLYGNMQLKIDNDREHTNVWVTSPLIALYSYAKDDYFYIQNTHFDYAIGADQTITANINNSLLNGHLQINKQDIQLEHLFNYFINRYITNYTFSAVNHQDTLLRDFNIHLRIPKMSHLNRYIAFPLRNVDSVNIDCEYKHDNKLWKAAIAFDNMNYDGINIHFLNMRSVDMDNHFITSIDAKQIGSGGDKWVNNVSIVMDVQMNNILMDIRSDSAAVFNNLRLNNTLSFLPQQGICFKVNNIAVDFLKKQYRLRQKGIFYWGKNAPRSDSFLSLKALDQQEELLIRPIYNDEGNKEVIQVILSKLDLAYFNPVLKAYNTNLQGFFNLQININNLFNSKHLTFDCNGLFENLKLNNTLIGNPIFVGNYYPINRDFYYDMENDNADFAVSSTGHINLGNRRVPLSADIVFNAINIPIHFIQPYISPVFDYVDGYTNGNITFKKRANNISMNGKLEIPHLLLRINYTKVDYIVEELAVFFKNNKIYFDDTKIKDYENSNNTAYIKADLVQNNLMSELNYGVHIRTDGIKVFNTNYKDGGLYGLDANAKGTFDIDGNEKRLNIISKAYPLEGSKLEVYTSRANGSNTLGNYITFKNYTKKAIQKDSIPVGTELNIQLDVDAQSNILADIWMNSSGEQKIKTEGTGNVRIVSNTQTPFAIYGKYNIAKGSYNLPIEYTEKLLFIDPRYSNYIEWTGDINGIANINLIYNIVNADFNSLVSTSTTTTTSIVPDQFKNFKGPVDITMQVKNTIFQPTFKFNLEIPSTNVLKNNPDAKVFFDRIESNETELVRQVSYLFITNSFAPADNIINSSVLVSGITGAVSSALSSQLNNVLSKPFGRIAPTLRFNVITDLYSSNSQQNNVTNPSIDRSKLGASISQTLFNNRLSYSVSTAVDFGFSSSNSRATFLPDAEVRYNIKKDGSIYVRAFYNNSIAQGDNSTLGKNSRQGAGIGYRKEFNSFKDLFSIKKDSTKSNKKEKKK